MAERIDKFCENLRVKLTSIDNEMQSLKAKIDEKVKTAGQDAQTQLNAVKKRIEQERVKVAAAQNDKRRGATDSMVLVCCISSYHLLGFRNPGELRYRCHSDSSLSR